MNGPNEPKIVSTWHPVFLSPPLRLYDIMTKGMYQFPRAAITRYREPGDVKQRFILWKLYSLELWHQGVGRRSSLQNL